MKKFRLTADFKTSISLIIIIFALNSLVTIVCSKDKIFSKNKTNYFEFEIVDKGLENELVDNSIQNLQIISKYFESFYKNNLQENINNGEFN